MKKTIKLNKGFTLLEALLSLLCFSCIVYLIQITVVMMINIKMPRFLIQDKISSHQLKQVFSLSENIVVNNNSIVFEYLNEVHIIKEINQKVINSPGTVIYFLDVQNAHFYKEGGIIYVSFTREGQQYTYEIGFY